MVIDEEAVIALAEAKNFNMIIFNQYLRYQKENRNEFPGKWSVEEYAAAKKLEDPEIDFFTHENLDWFGIWMGFGGEYSTPDCLSFFRYCGCRDLYPYNELKQNSVTRKLKKEEN